MQYSKQILLLALASVGSVHGYIGFTGPLNDEIKHLRSENFALQNKIDHPNLPLDAARVVLMSKTKEVAKTGHEDLENDQENENNLHEQALRDYLESINKLNKEASVARISKLKAVNAKISGLLEQVDNQDKQDRICLEKMISNTKAALVVAQNASKDWDEEQIRHGEVLARTNLSEYAEVERRLEKELKAKKDDLVDKFERTVAFSLLYDKERNKKLEEPQVEQGNSLQKEEGNGSIYDASAWTNNNN